MNTFLFAGYLMVWTVLLIYLVFLQRRQSQLNSRLKALVERVEKQGGPAA